MLIQPTTAEHSVSTSGTLVNKDSGSAAQAPSPKPPPRQPQPQPPGRDLALDFVRGWLVVVMVVYHAMNYFSSAEARYYGYLRFVNGSFVFLSGYAIALFHQHKRSGLASAQALKLFWRGGRLLLLFTALNLAISLLGLTSYKSAQFSVGRFFGNAFDIYVLGRGDAMAFRILVPIAYVIMVAPLFLMWPRVRSLLMLATLLAASTYTLVTANIAPNVFFALLGLVGMSLGFVTAKHLPRGTPSWPLMAIGSAVLVWSMDWLSGNVALYGLGIACLLKLVYDAARRLNMDAWVSLQLQRLGAYSLLAYIAQIAFLHGLRRLPVTAQPLGIVELLLIGLLTTIFLVGLCQLVSHLRQRSAWADRGYRWVFG
jgi:OpgC protein